MYSRRTYATVVVLWIAAKLATTIDGDAWLSLRFLGHVTLWVIFAVMAHDIYREAKAWLAKHPLREAGGPLAMNLAYLGGGLWLFAAHPFWLATVLTAAWLFALITVTGLVRGLLRVRREGWPA